MFNLTSPVTGGAQTGFTTPAYVIVADVAPDTNGKQYAVTSVTGTQTGVLAHTASSPFTALFVRPKAFKALGQVNPVTGKLTSVPLNTWYFKVQKGVVPLAGQAPRPMTIRASMDVPAGSDTADSANVRACVAFFIGCLNQQSAGLGDSLVSGIG